MTGKYEEAAEAYRKIEGGDAVAAAIGLAHCRAAVGDQAGAKKVLTDAAAKHSENARLAAELADLEFHRGEHEAAAKHVEAALRLKKDEALARWVQAELFRASGKLKDADAAYKWFVDFYNEKDEIKDANTLRLVGLGAAQYAQWNRLSEQYSFLVNELYPDILKLEKNYWLAHYEAGLLFLEKYNQADAAREFNKALAINPNAAEAHAAMAALALQNYELPQAKRSIERALEINPELLWAKQLQADLQLANFEIAEAIETLGEALKLNPRSEETLGRLAAAYVARDGMGQVSVGNALRGVPEAANGVATSNGPPERHRGGSLQNTTAGQASSGTRTPNGEAKAISPPERHRGRSLQKLIAEVNARNAHAGDFYNAAGYGLDLLRRYPAAGRFYAEAIERMPQLAAPYGQLGLIQMRLAEEVAAEKTLKKAFEIDPFNVRVSNSIKVLEVLAGYATIETEHFVIRFDRGQDEVLARSAARYLEVDVYPALSKRLGYEPQGKSLFEFFSRAKNTDGHGWFSARMVGLPYVGTVGACAGRVVAMQSPNDGKIPFNWARVLRHEFVHVVNLQQTDFNIPHWFTEALAVLNEDLPRPAIWDKLLAEAVKSDKLFSLATINGGFARPKSGNEWNLAYCQAELYARYMLARFGDEALAKMLAAYAENLTTTAAIERSFSVKQDDFERSYLEHVKKVVAANVAGDEEEPSLSEMKKLHADKPDDLDVKARLAAAYLRAERPQDARKLADDVLKQEPKQQLATYVLARLRMRAGETESVVELLEKSLDRERPQKNHLALLAGLKLKAEQFVEAADLYELGRRKFAGDPQWAQALARVYLKSGDDQKLAEVLAELAAADADTLAVRKKLALLAYERKDWLQAARWAGEAIHIDVRDAEMHRIAGEAAANQGKHGDAIDAFQLAIRLDERDVDARVGLVRAFAAAEQRDKARVELEALRKLAPEDERVEALEELLTK